MIRGVFWGMLVSLTLALNPVRAEDTIDWVGCGISKLGYMQDLSAAFGEKNRHSISTGGRRCHPRPARHQLREKPSGGELPVTAAERQR